MQENLLEKLSVITDEEKKLLSGEKQIETSLYFFGSRPIIDSKKMLENGKLITIRKHTRFVKFPKHRHNFIEMQYVCHGSITNVIDDKQIKIEQGEMLILGQNIYHEILECSENDIIINFIVLPEFFEVARKMIGNQNILSDFLIESLKMQNSKSGALHFKTADNIQVQNLVENMIYSLISKQNNEDMINRATMGLLFMHLLNSAGEINSLRSDNNNDFILMTVMKYIEDFYQEGSLNELSEMLNYSSYNLSKLIKLQSGYTFKQLLQAKRLKKAVEYLCETDMSVTDIIVAVGYENSSYFHRMFKEKYNMSPHEFRSNNKNKSIVNIKKKKI